MATGFFGNLCLKVTEKKSVHEQLIHKPAPCILVEPELSNLHTTRVRPRSLVVRYQLIYYI